jgi:hypothetical protein
LEQTIKRRAAGLGTVSIILKVGDSESLTPPLSQIAISFLASGFSDGKNQKNNRLISSGSVEIGSVPA